MDPQQQQAFNHLAGMGAGIFAFFMLFALACVVFGIFLFWRIFTKAGLAGPLALLVLVPGIGWIIVLCILAFAQWRVVPAPYSYNAMTPPQYPPTYPPANYPPQGPTA